MSKLKVGDKVVPVSKSEGVSIDKSIWMDAKKPYLFVTGRAADNNIYCSLTSNIDSHSEVFLESDLIPFEEVVARIEPKAPVWYTLPKPVEEKREPDYKGFHDFIMSIVFTEKPCDLCFNAPRAYAENKFIKRNI